MEASEVAGTGCLTSSTPPHSTPQPLWHRVRPHSRRVMTIQRWVLRRLIFPSNQSFDNFDIGTCNFQIGWKWCHTLHKQLIIIDFIMSFYLDALPLVRILVCYSKLRNDQFSILLKHLLKYVCQYLMFEKKSAALVNNFFSNVL